VNVAYEIRQDVHRIDARGAAIMPAILIPRHLEISARQQMLIEIQEPKLVNEQPPHL